MENFLKAAKKKLRFATAQGFLTPEELFDLSLPSLDVIAKTVNKLLKAEGEESFIGTKTVTNSDNELRLEILKEVIAIKLAEKKASENRAAKKEKLAQFKILLANKENEEMGKMSKAKLLKQIEDLENDEDDDEE